VSSVTMAEEIYIYVAPVKALSIDEKFMVSFATDNGIYVVYRDGDNTFLRTKDASCKLFYFGANCYFVAVISDGECKALNKWMLLGSIPKKVTQS